MPDHKFQQVKLCYYQWGFPPDKDKVKESSIESQEYVNHDNLKNISKILTRKKNNFHDGKEKKG